MATCAPDFTLPAKPPCAPPNDAQPRPRSPVAFSPLASPNVQIRGRRRAARGKCWPERADSKSALIPPIRGHEDAPVKQVAIIYPFCCSEGAPAPKSPLVCPVSRREHAPAENFAMVSPSYRP
eukprot:9503948-Pyramimonas_sp.AAC.1